MGQQNAKIRAARVWRKVREYRIDFSLPLVAAFSALRRRDASKFGGKEGNPRSILVVRLDAMGDLIMTTPIFRELKLRYPDASITAVVQQRNRELLETNPHVDRILHPPPTGKSRLFPGVRRQLALGRLYRESLRDEGFDIGVLPRLGPDIYGAAGLMKLADPPVILRYDDSSQRGLGGMLTRCALRSAVSLQAPSPQHEVRSNLDIVERLTGKSATSAPELFLTEADRDYARGVLASASQGATIMGLAFGAQARRRVWPLERWAEVIRSLGRDHTVFVAIVCARGERADAESLQAMLPVDSRLVCGATVREAAACLEACDIFLGPDSGLAHLAAAVNCVPLVVSPHPLDGDPNHDNSPVRYGPWIDGARTIQPEHGTPPCSSGCDAIEAHCILHVTPEQVARAADEMLRSVRRPAIDANS